MNLMTEYVVACVNLYGRVPIEVVKEIYRLQNEDELVYDEKQLHELAILVEGDDFVSEWYDGEEDPIVEDIPYIMLPWEDLRHYVDEDYFEMNEHYQKVEQFLLDNGFEDTEDLLDEFYNMIQLGGDKEDLIETSKTFGVDFKGEKRKLFELLQSILTYHTRIKSLHGFMNSELLKATRIHFEKPEARLIAKSEIDAYNFTEKRNEKLNQSDLSNSYVVALCHLYGMVPIDKVKDIYVEQNGEVSFDYDEDVLEVNFVYVHKGWFVSEYIMEFNEFETEKAMRSGKPYYVPKRDELLKYVDEFYFEKGNTYDYLMEWLLRHDVERADEIVEDIHGSHIVGSKMQTIIQNASNLGLTFENLEEANEFVGLVSEFMNDTRLPVNNGFKPNELFKEEKKHLNPLPKKEKIGRNDPCPCGSGKKYKKCCLGKIVH